MGMNRHVRGSGLRVGMSSIHLACCQIVQYASSEKYLRLLGRLIAILNGDDDSKAHCSRNRIRQRHRCPFSLRLIRTISIQLHLTLPIS